MISMWWGWTKFVSLAGANTDLQNKVHVGARESGLGGNVLKYNLNRVGACGTIFPLTTLTILLKEQSIGVCTELGSSTV